MYPKAILRFPAYNTQPNTQASIACGTLIGHVTQVFGDLPNEALGFCHLETDAHQAAFKHRMTELIREYGNDYLRNTPWAEVQVLIGPLAVPYPTYYPRTALWSDIALERSPEAQTFIARTPAGEMWLLANAPAHAEILS